MANEITINIESSLAAMAFVIADQQQLIKDERQTANDWKDEFHRADERYHEAHAACMSLREENQKIKNELEEKLEDVHSLQLQNNTLNEQIQKITLDLDAMECNRPQWTPYISEETGLTIDEYPSQPVILVKRKVIKEGLVYITGKDMPVGTIYITHAYVEARGGKYYFPNSDPFTSVLSWCIMKEDMIIEPDFDISTTR